MPQLTLPQELALLQVVAALDQPHAPLGPTLLRWAFVVPRKTAVVPRSTAVVLVGRRVQEQTECRARLVAARLAVHAGPAE